MCGLVGVFNKRSNGFNSEQRDAFSTLLLIDTLRGEDSTGAFMVTYDGNVEIAKEASTAGEFLQKKEWKKIFSNSWNHGACLIGHNRKATKGTVCDENAHPFTVEDNIVLVHNGGMYGDHKKHANVEVDSHAIAHLIHEHGIEKALGKFYGAYALIWYNVEEESVYLVRNKERPLWWMETTDSWIWASEKAMLMFTAARCNLKVLQGPIQLDEDRLNVFKMQNKTWDVSHRQITIDRDFDASNVTTGQDNFGKKQVGFEVEDWRDYMVSGIDPTKECALPPVLEKKPEDRALKSVLNLACTCTIGGNSWEKTSTFELDLCRNTNRSMTLGEFNAGPAKDYAWGALLRASAFEWVDDGEQGYYLYASPLDDHQIVIRHHFPKVSKITEERIMTMALNEWIFDFTVDKKSWTEFEKAERPTANQEGYCLVSSSKCKIIEGGPYKNGERKDNAHA